MPGRLVGVLDHARSQGDGTLLLTVFVFVGLALVVAASGRALGPRVFYVAALAPLWTLGWSVWAMTRLDDGPLVERHTWVEQLGLAVDLRLDWFTMVMVLLIAGIGLCVFWYAASYFHPGPEVPRTAAVLLLFAGSMFGLVCSDNLFLLFMFWELTSITSFLLIGTDDTKPGPRTAALHALLVTGGGGLAMLGGFVLLGQAAGTYSLHAILESPPSGTTVSVGLVLVLVGALTKSAQVPFHAWLPGAMAAPTPISAYLHSATMVKAGVYLVGRFAPAFAVVGPWRWIVLSAGSASLLLGGYRALRQHDLKLVLAFGTISQLGLLMILFGAGVPELAFAGCVLLVAHAAFKAALFLTVGIIDHQTHTRDLRALTGLGRRWPVVAVGAALAAASMAGIPPLLGFLAKELALDGLLGDGVPAQAVLTTLVVVGSMFTVAYSARFVWGAFGLADTHHGLERSRVGSEAPHPSKAFAVAPMLLAALGVLFGLVPALLAPLVDDAWEALGFEGHAPHLSLWHGLTVPLGLSALVIAGGVVLFLARVRVERLQAAVPRLPSALGAYERSVRGLLSGSDRVAAVFQSGSLPVYLMVLLGVLVVAPGIPLLLNGGPERWPDLVDSPLQLVVGAIMIAAALAAAISRRRFAAVILLGAVGYGISALFIIQGAPDLALTQLLIETLGVVAFVLVLRHLPEGFTPTMAPARKILPAIAGVAVALFVFYFAISAGSVTGTPTPDASLAGTDSHAELEHGETETGDITVSEEYLARSLPEAHGRNVVNVIVVDFRGFDTLGEITVLVVAALGVAALIVAGRRDPDGSLEDPEDVEKVEVGG
ncbi:MAG TPA: hydrogen gas-evolving membrane-bound hydrogenase subunit E [Acidimicrobiales bacterium]